MPVTMCEPLHLNNIDYSISHTIIIQIHVTVSMNDKLILYTFDIGYENMKH